MRIGVVIAVLLFMIVAPASAAAVTIAMPVDPALIGPTLTFGSLVFPVNGVAGITLDGQVLSLDLIFAEDLLARVFDAGVNGLNPVLRLFTNAPSDCAPEPSPAVCRSGVGDPPPASLLSPDGTPFHIVEEPALLLSDPELRVAFVTTAPPGGERYDISGFRLGLELPSTGFEITGGQLVLFIGPDSNLVFGTAAQLPEPGSLTLLAVVLPALAVARRVARFKSRDTTR